MLRKMKFISSSSVEAVDAVFIPELALRLKQEIENQSLNQNQFLNQHPQEILPNITLKLENSNVYVNGNLVTTDRKVYFLIIRFLHEHNLLAPAWY